MHELKLRTEANHIPSAILVLVFLGSLATYTGYVIGQMKWRYPHISTMADAGEVIGGKWGREFLGAAQIIFFIFIMASHLLTFTVAMNTITNHGTCSIVFGIVGMVISFICSLPRTLEKMSWLSIVCMFPSHLPVLPTYHRSKKTYQPTNKP